MKKNVVYTIAGVLIFVGLAITIWYLIILFQNDFNFWNEGELSIEKGGQFGDFIGGFVGTIISLAGFIYLYLTLKEQRIAFQKERFESRFFELITLHRNNVNELSFTEILPKESEVSNIKLSNYEDYNGKKTFKAIFDQFIQIRNELKSFFDIPETEIFEPAYLKLITVNQEISKRKLKPKLIAKIDICHSIVFYGTSSEGLITLSRIFKTKYQTSFVESILRYISLKPVADEEIIWNKWIALSKRNSLESRKHITKEIYLERKKKRKSPTISDLWNKNLDNEIIIGYHNKYKKYYGGHQFRLGHYFRHLFQTVKYVNNQNFISYPEKYEYVKILRAQLSTYEQAILFINSLSNMGYVWELFPEFTHSTDPEEEYSNKINNQLISKYNLIKNLPGDTLYGLNFRVAYPDVQFEGEHVERDNSLYK